MNGTFGSILAGGALNALVVVLMNGFTLVLALVIMAALPEPFARSLALGGFAAVYLWATWRALVRLAEDKGWTPFRRHMVFALGHFLTVMLLLEIVITLL